MFYDTHAHLDFAPPDTLTSVLDGARHAGIVGWMVPGVSAAERVLEPHLSRSDVSHAVGIHPGFLPSDLGESALEEALRALEAHARAIGARAIGECGLDSRVAVPMRLQQRWLEAQLALARTLELPVLFHQVGARREFLETLERVGARGILHGFSGDLGWAKALVKRGLVLGLGPGLLAATRARLAEVATEIPLASLALETDLPKSRATEFAPLVLVDIAERLASLRAMPLCEVARITTETALGLFGLDGG